MAEYKMVNTLGKTELTGLKRYKDLNYLGQQDAREEMATGILYDYYDNPKRYARTNYKKVMEEVESYDGGDQEKIRAVREYCYKQLERELRKEGMYFTSIGEEVVLVPLPQTEGLYVYRGRFLDEKPRAVAIVKEKK